MDDEAEANRELERLREELTEFVVAGLAGRAASGEQPELTGAIADAIDRRVDRAVESRVAEMRFPDPDEFAREVIAAARLAGGGEEAPRRASSSRDDEVHSARSKGLLAFLLGALTATGVALLAYLVYSALARPAPILTNSPVPIANGIENTSAGPINILVEGGNQAALPANQQGPTP